MLDKRKVVISLFFKNMFPQYVHTSILIKIHTPTPFVGLSAGSSPPRAKEDQAPQTTWEATPGSRALLGSEHRQSQAAVPQGRLLPSQQAKQGHKQARKQKRGPGSQPSPLKVQWSLLS